MINSMLTLLDLSNMHTTHILDVAVVVVEAAEATTTTTKILFWFCMLTKSASFKQDL
jgi:hypothetical protein